MTDGQAQGNSGGTMIKNKRVNPGHYQIRSNKSFRAELSKYQDAGFLPPFRKDVGPVPFSLPFDWHADPMQDRNWMFQLHAWRNLDAYFTAIHHRDGADHALDRVIAIISDWHRGNVADGLGDWTWYDMSTGIRASKLAFLAQEMSDLGRDICDYLFIDELVTLHFENLLDPRKLNPGNHGLFQIWGLKSLAAAFADHQLSALAEDYAIRKMSELVSRQLGEYGVHTENSPAYHFFGMARIRDILKAPEWDIPQLNFINEKLDAGEKVKPWLLDPAGRMICVGDTSPSIVDRSKLPQLKAWPHDTKGGVLGAVLDGYAVVRSCPNTPPDRSSLLFLTASFQTPTHKHSDCLSFVWQENGEDILVDSGKYGYSKDPFRSYFLSTHAHNTVEFNGKSARRKAEDAYGSGIHAVERRADGWFIDAEAPHPANGYTHRRSVIFRPGREVIVFDHVRPSKLRKLVENNYTLWWHFPPGIQVTANGAQASVSGFNSLEGLEMRHYSTDGRSVAQICRGETGERYQGWISTSYLEAESAPVVGYTARQMGAYVAVTVLRIAMPQEPTDDSRVRNALLTEIAQLDWAEEPLAALRKACMPTDRSRPS